MISIPSGFNFVGTHCGIKKSKKDLSLFYSAHPCITSAVFTRNLVKASPVIVSKKHLSKSGRNIQAVIVNSGCANACTGRQGLKDAFEMCSLTGECLGLKPEQVVIGSTGIIGRYLPMAKVRSGIRKLCNDLKENTDRTSSVFDAVDAIMTTDRVKKISTRTLNIGGKKVKILSCIKGSGMVHPDMATLLGFIFTDINITKNLLDTALKNAVEQSLNCISVDGDTSTNDSVFVLANGLAGNECISSKNSKEFKKFSYTLTDLCEELARMVVSDGEGATKLVTVVVKSARTRFEAKKVAQTIATSPLVKTAIFGSDPNFGRVMAAAGRSGVNINPERIDVYFDNLCVYSKGCPINFCTKEAKKVLSKKKLSIIVNLNQGKTAVKYYTCDLSYDYIRINAEYCT